MRGVEERSLSSILRSKLPTTLINMMYGEKLMLAGCARTLDEFHAIAAVFRARIGGDQASCLRSFIDVKSYFLSAECCPVTQEAVGSSPVAPKISGLHLSSANKHQFVGARTCRRTSALAAQRKEIRFLGRLWLETLVLADYACTKHARTIVRVRSTRRLAR